MEAYSLDNAGMNVAFKVFCHNVQLGVGIDYAMGESWREESAAPQDPQSEQQEEHTYALNTNTRKFHHPERPSVD